jgi:hypothetical protein
VGRGERKGEAVLGEDAADGRGPPGTAAAAAVAPTRAVRAQDVGGGWAAARANSAQGGGRRGGPRRGGAKEEGGLGWAEGEGGGARPRWASGCWPKRGGIPFLFNSLFSHLNLFSNTCFHTSTQRNAWTGMVQQTK